MIVVSNTSPLNYLVLVGTVYVLPELFQQVYVPEQVAIELGHPTAPQPVRNWIAAPPKWLVIRAPKRVESN